jgi:GDP-mannose 6-dehydrogenase
MRVAVFGLGYVGVVSAACLAEGGHDVIGVDVNPVKVKMVLDGTSPILEDRIEDLVKAAVAAGKLRATGSAEEAVAGSDISLISAGTPSGPTGAPMLDAVDACVEAIGRAIRSGNPNNHTVIVRSTIPPGTTEKRLRPILEKASGRTIGNGLDLCFNPEFLREGSSVHDFHHPPQTIIGSFTAEGHEAVERLYAGIEAPVVRTNCTLAESVKYLCNAFHAVKIGFANEAGAVLKAMGVDARDALSALCNDTVLNISPAYLRPGFAFGGSCLPKDLKGFLYAAQQHNVRLPFLGHLLESNQAHIDRAFDMIARLGRRKVALFGLAFKPGTDDLRESPLVTLAERLIGKGYELAIYDRYVDASRLLGKNREFIDREIPHFERLLAASAEEAIARSETIVVGHADRAAQAVIASGHGGRPVIDLQGLRALQTAEGMRYEGICW